jgi:diacylglycerol kinase (ATP)
MRVTAIVNPAAGNGRCKRLWPALETTLPHAWNEVETQCTDGPQSATMLTAEALKAGADIILAVGGDGTLNEVVNGFFEGGKPIAPQAALATITCGTGGDFRRSLGLPKSPEAQARALATAQIRAIDIGCLHCEDWDGNPLSRHFINLASFGLTGAVAREVNQARFSKRLGGTLPYFAGALTSFARFSCPAIRLHLDDRPPKDVAVWATAVCNGQFFGGGMRVAPKAQPDDGLFDVVVVGYVPRIRLLWYLPSVYSGQHTQLKEVDVQHAKRVHAEARDPSEKVPIEMDGEAIGTLPATFEILPQALRMLM